MENRNDLKISGAGTLSGGFYNNVTVSGAAEINGDLDCMDFNASGVCKIKGNVKAQDVSVSGETKISGNLECNKFRISGHSKVDDNVVVKKLDISGAAEIGGSVSAESISVKGGVKIEGNCNSENFVSKGGFNISGLLKSENVEVELYVKCKAKEINGEKIDVRKGTSSIFNKLIKPLFNILYIYEGLTVETIDGDDIYLEHTKAKAVRGNTVRIGPGCEIVLVQYKDTFEQLGDAKIGESKKME